MKYKIGQIHGACIEDVDVKGKIIERLEENGHLHYCFNIIKADKDIQIHQNEEGKKNNSVWVNEFEIDNYIEQANR